MTPSPRWTRDPHLDRKLDSLEPTKWYEDDLDRRQPPDRPAQRVQLHRPQPCRRARGTNRVEDGRPVVGTQTMPTKNILRLRLSP